MEGWKGWSGIGLGGSGSGCGSSDTARARARARAFHPKLKARRTRSKPVHPSHLPAPPPTSRTTPNPNPHTTRPPPLSTQVGLNGIDNGAIRFTHVRVPRGNLLDRFASVDKSGRYSSPLTSQARR